MKNTILRSLSVIMAVLMLVTAVPFAAFAVCEPDKHEYGNWTTTKEATCTTAGERTRKCKLCNANNIQTIAATGHTYPAAKTVVQEATCKADGYKAFVCTKCQAEKSGSKEVLPKLTHEWVNNTNAAFLKSEANCKTPATYYKSCKKCQEKSTETFPDGTTAPAKHTELVPLGTDTPATCGAKGYDSGKKCKDCGITVSQPQELPKLAHTPDPAKVATCTTKAVCSACTFEYGEFNPENHKEIKTDAAEAATCTVTGKTEGKHCEACKAVITAQEVIPVVPHKEKVIAKQEPTCTEKGKEAEKVCEDCNAHISGGEEIEAKGHIYGDWAYPKDYECTKGGKISRICTVCKQGQEDTVSAGTHNEIIDDVAIAPTCTAEGKTAGRHCGVCKAVLQAQETVAALGHDHGEAISNNDVTHSFKCKRCSETVDPTGCVDADSNCKCDVCEYDYTHIFTTYVSDNNATCVQDGTETAKCDYCGVATDTRTAVDSKKTGAHSYVYATSKEATCITDKLESGTCSLCGNVDTREVPDTRLGHDESEWKLPDGFDCTIGGIKKTYCKRCNDVINTETISPKAHEEKVDASVEATCTTDGKTKGLHCGYCDKVIIEQITISALGHESVDGVFVQTKAPDCEKAGAKESTCKRCNQKYTVEVPALGHKYAPKIVKATCTKDGYTEYTCSVCKNSYRNNVIKAAGHKMVKTVTPAKYRQRGSITSTCSVCGYKTSARIYRIETVKLSKTTYVRDGKVHTPTVTVKDYKGKVLKKGTDYTVKYSSGRKNIGTYKVTITFKGNYTGTKVLTFKITPAKVTGLKATAGKKLAKISWNKVKYATTYVVYYSTSANGTYKKAGTTTKLTLSKTKLTTGKTYYFKVKAGKKTDSGAVVYGPLTSVKKVKIK